MIDYCKTCVHDVDREDFCDNCYFCDMLNGRGIAPTGYEEAKKQTNADRIRSMSDEELAKWLRNIRYSWTCVPRDNGNRCSDFNDDCNACWLDWLNKECE